MSDERKVRVGVQVRCVLLVVADRSTGTAIIVQKYRQTDKQIAPPASAGRKDASPHPERLTPTR